MPLHILGTKTVLKDCLYCGWRLRLPLARVRVTSQKRSHGGGSSPSLLFGADRQDGHSSACYERADPCADTTDYVVGLVFYCPIRC
jgi:hypothetical protein